MVEYKIEERGFYTGDRGHFSLIGEYNHTFEFEDAQSMFDCIVDRWSFNQLDLQPSLMPELSPSIGLDNNTLFFDKTNIIERREYSQDLRKKPVWRCTSELIITDDEENRVNIDSLINLIGLEGVDSTGIRIRDGKIDPTTSRNRPTIIYDDWI